MSFEEDIAAGPSLISDGVKLEAMAMRASAFVRDLERPVVMVIFNDTNDAIGFADAVERILDKVHGVGVKEEQVHGLTTGGPLEALGAAIEEYPEAFRTAEEVQKMRDEARANIPTPAERDAAWAEVMTLAEADERATGTGTIRMAGDGTIERVPADSLFQPAPDSLREQFTKGAGANAHLLGGDMVEVPIKDWLRAGAPDGIYGTTKGTIEGCTISNPSSEGFYACRAERSEDYNEGFEAGYAVARPLDPGTIHIQSLHPVDHVDNVDGDD